MIKPCAFLETLKHTVKVCQSQGGHPTKTHRPWHFVSCFLILHHHSLDHFGIHHKYATDITHGG
jgi:hypothetical protein